MFWRWIREPPAAVPSCSTMSRISVSYTHLLTHQTVAGLGEAHHRRGGACTLRVCDNNGLAALHDSHAAVGSTKAVSYTHLVSPHRTVIGKISPSWKIDEKRSIKYSFFCSKHFCSCPKRSCIRADYCLSLIHI